MMAQSATEQSGADETILRGLEQRRWQAVTEGRPGEAVVFYAPDAVLLEPNQPPFRGHEAIRDFWFHHAASGATAAGEPVSIEVAGSADLAFVLGTFRWAGSGRLGRIEVTGPYVTTWKWLDGQWKIILEISNSSSIVGEAPSLASAGKEVFRRAIQMWSTGDLSAFDELVAMDYVGHVAAGDRDREGLQRRIIEFNQLYPDIEFTVEDQRSDGDMVTTRLTARGTNSKSGQTTKLMGINMSRIADGKIAEEWNTWEVMA